MRRIATVAVVALLVAGGGAAIVMRGGPALSDAWAKARRHSLATWAAVERQASEAWVAIRSHLPIDSPPASPQRPPVRDATASRGTHRHAQPPAAPGRGKALAKRGRDDINTPGSTP